MFSVAMWLTLPYGTALENSILLLPCPTIAYFPLPTTLCVGVVVVVVGVHVKIFKHIERLEKL